MKLLLEANKIRLRLSSFEFEQLAQTKELRQEFAYLPLKLKLSLNQESLTGLFTQQQLQLTITFAEYQQLANPDYLKTGITSLVEDLNGNLLTIEIQLDSKPRT